MQFEIDAQVEWRGAEGATGASGVDRGAGPLGWLPRRRRFEDIVSLTGAAMDISKWEVFLKVADVLNVTAAAEQLHLSQSGVSYILKCLEQETGFPLFVRHKQGVALSAPAEELLPVIRGFLGEKEKIGQIISGINGLARGTLRIATYQSTGITWLPEILRQFKKDFPQIEIDIREGGDEAIESALSGRRVDLAFSSLRERPDCEWIGLADDHLKAVLPTKHKYADLERVPLALFEDEPFISSINAYEYDMNHVLRSHRIKPRNIVCRSTEAFAVMAMVRKGLGVSLLFDRVIQAGGAYDLAIKDTGPAVSHRLGIALASRERASPAAKMFIEYAEDIVSTADSL